MDDEEYGEIHWTCFLIQTCTNMLFFFFIWAGGNYRKDVWIIGLREIERGWYSCLFKYNYPYKTSQTTEILFLFQEQNLPQKKKSHNSPTLEILSTYDNFPCQQMFDIFQNAPEHPINCPYEKKNLILFFFPLFELLQHLNHKVFIILFRSLDMNVFLHTSNHHSWSSRCGH